MLISYSKIQNIFAWQDGETCIFGSEMKVIKAVTINKFFSLNIFGRLYLDLLIFFVLFLLINLISKIICIHKTASNEEFKCV